MKQKKCARCDNIWLLHGNVRYCSACCRRSNMEAEYRQTDSDNETNIEMNNQEALGNDSCIDKKQYELHNDRYSHVPQNII